MKPSAHVERNDVAVRFDAVTKRFDDVTALNTVSLDIARGEFLTLLGPSGCGKTTLLKLAAGFLGPDGGTILIDGKRAVGAEFELDGQLCVAHAHREVVLCGGEAAP